MKERILKAILASMLIMTLTMADFVLLTVTAVTYAVDALTLDKETDHKNVEFMAYFKDAEEKSVEEYSVKANSTDLKLVMEVLVKQEGYFNGTISLENSNFKFKTDSKNDRIQSISENEIVLNQIKAGDSVKLEVGIDIVKNTDYDVSLLNQESLLKLSGTYRDSKQKDIKVSGKRNVTLTLISPYDKENNGIELKQTVLTNKVFNLDGTQKRVIQLKLESILHDNLYPVKTSKIELDVPTIGTNKPSSVKVQTPQTLVTNNKLLQESEYNYDVESGKVQISISNPEVNGKVVWNQEGEDSYIVTYVFDSSEMPEEQMLKGNSEIILYDARTTTMKASCETSLPTKEIDAAISVHATTNESEIYKGKLYEGIDKEFTQNIAIQVNLENMADSIEVVENYDNMNLSNIYTKNVVVNKENLTTILGDDGKITIMNLNNEVLSEITKDNTLVELPENTPQIRIQTTKPQKSGILNILTTKVVKANSKEVVKAATEMEYKLKSNYMIGEAKNDLADSSAKIILKETETKITLDVSKKEFTTMRTNENVEFRVTLHSNSEKYELLKNPHVSIVLPEEFENIEVTNISLYQEEEQFKITKQELLGKTIDIQLSGEQKEYTTSAQDTIILITANLTTSKKQKNVARQIVLNYNNQKGINYANDGQDVKDIQIVSYAGFITTNKIVEYGIETINEDGNNVAKLQLAAENKLATVSGQIINNQEANVTNVRILGTYPTQKATNANTIETAVGEVQVSNIDASRVHVYYSENENATENINDSANAWVETISSNSRAKKYLVIVDSLQADEEITLSYQVAIPGNLEYNESLSEGYTVYYTTATNTEQSIQAKMVTLETGKGPIIETSLKALVGGKEVTAVKEGEKIEYQIIAKNTGSESVKGLKLVGMVPEHTALVKESKVPTMEESNEEALKAFEMFEDKEVIFDNLTLNPGEELTKTYMVKALNEIEGTKNIENTVIATYGEAKKSSNTVKTNLEEGLLDVEIMAVDNYDGNEVHAGYQYRYLVKVTNIANKELKNIKLQINKQNLIIQELLYVKDEELVSADNTDSFTLSKLASGETFELSVYTLGEEFADTEVKQSMIQAVVKIDNEEYNSNQLRFDVASALITISNESQSASQYVKAGEKVIYNIQVVNKGQRSVSNVKIEDIISRYTSVISVTCNDVKLAEDEYEITDNLEKQEENILTIETMLDVNEVKRYVITTEVDGNMDNAEAINIENKATVYAYNVELENAVVTNIIEPVKLMQTEKDDTAANENIEKEATIGQPIKEIEDDENGENEEKPSENEEQVIEKEENNNSNNQGESEQKPENVQVAQKLISGYAWLDQNENGQKDSDETVLQGIIVKLINVETNKYQTNTQGNIITATTNEKGMYTLQNVPQGKYIIVFEYDDSKYILTTYAKNGVAIEYNSKVIDKELTIDNESKVFAATEVVTVADEHISYMNIGLKERKIYDMKLEKTISRVVVQNGEGTKATEYANATLAKVEVNSKELNNTTVVVEYVIKVTNEGQVAGYVKNIVDYISADYKFSSELNKDWYQSGSNIYNSSLSNTKIEPGESKTITLILTKQMTENNTGLINNTAEIMDTYNEQGLKDLDSTENNRINGEDDMGSADLIISIKTGQVVAIIGIVLSVIVVLGAVTYISTKKILSKKII